MILLYPYFKKKAVILTICFGLLFSSVSLGQVCGPIVEDFSNTGGSTAGFSSSTQGSPSPGFVLGSNGQNTYLERCNIPAAGTTYQIITPTYKTLASQTTIGFGFELSGQVEASQVYFFVDYINSNTGTVSSQYVAAVNPVYSSNSTSICLNFSTSALPGFTPGGSYRINIFVVAASSSNNNQCIVFDNFRTTGAASQIILPVTFTNIIARKSGNSVELIWNVAGEKEVSRYEVERSNNGRDFTKIGEVSATEKAVYTYSDNQPGNGVIFYRVRNVDQDGKFAYTKIARVNLNKAVLLNAFPQPAKNDITIEHGTAVNGKITIASGNGQVMKTIAVTPGVNQTNINIANLNAGIYIIRFDNGYGSIETLKIVKQ